MHLKNGDNDNKLSMQVEPMTLIKNKIKNIKKNG